MNRFVLLAIICFISSQEITGQEWQLFPMGQRSYFNTTNGSEFVTSRFITHERTDGNRLVQYFAHNLDTLCNPWDLTLGLHWIYIDSISKENQLIEFVNAGSTLLLDLNAINGEYWFFDYGEKVPHLNFNRVKLTYLGAGEQTFLGISDSIKKFSIEAYQDTTPVLHWVNDHQFVLSKTFGLLEGVFLSFDEYGSGIRVSGETIIGLENGQVSAGFNMPALEKFFPYQVGDIYKWEGNEHGMVEFYEGFYLYRDSIIAIEWKNNEFRYTYNRHQFSKIRKDQASLPVEEYTFLQDQVKVFDLSFYQDIANAQSNYRIFPLHSNEFLWHVSYSIDITSIHQVAINAQANFGWMINCIAGEASDFGHYFKINERTGIYHYGQITSSFELIGYKNQHGEYGNTWPLNVREVENSVLKIQLFPNPVQDKLRIEWEGFPDGMLTIYSASGIRILSDTISNKAEVDLSSFNSGIYLVKLEIDGIIQYRKFAKM